MRHLVTGGAGFIGSHLVDRLLAEGHEVVAFDNLSSGKEAFLAGGKKSPRFRFVRGELLDAGAVRAAMKGVEFVHHLAANPDIRYGIANTDWDLKQNLLTTQIVLEAMRVEGCRRIALSSTSAVYGERVPMPTPESAGPALPISLYGASKLGAEAYVSAFVGTFGFQGWVWRFANIVGPRGTHGVILDFIDKLKKDPTRLEILGDGAQRKSYLVVDELVDAMTYLAKRADAPVNVFNLGSGDNVTVKRIAEIVVERLALKDVRFDYTGGPRGWPGDVPKMLLDASAAAKLGWKAKRSSEEAVREAVDALVAERW
jgi:UDP-glucose 4-epimerase